MRDPETSNKGQTRHGARIYHLSKPDLHNDLNIETIWKQLNIEEYLVIGFFFFKGVFFLEHNFIFLSFLWVGWGGLGLFIFFNEGTGD